MTDMVRFTTDSGEVALSKQIIKDYICRNATDQEIEMFLQLCKYRALNPWLKQAYLVKYGNNPATMIVGWHVFLERAQKNPAFDGYEVEVYDQEDKPYRGREGQVISHATAKVYRKDRQHPTVVTALFREYSTGQGPWAPGKIPTTMIRKVALEQALRETFPSDFQGMYGAEEMRLDPDTLPEPRKVNVTEVVANGHTEEPEPPDDEEQASEEVQDVVDMTPEPPKEPEVSPFRVLTLLTTLHGAKWTQTGISRDYFGVLLKTTKDFQAFAQSNPDAWKVGVAKLVEAAKKAKK